MSADDISECLLDCAKGRLSEEACAEVEAAARADAAISEELAYYKGLVGAGELGSVHEASPGELGWARLSRELDGLEGAQDLPERAANDNSRLWKFAAIALGILAIGQFSSSFIGSPAQDTARYVPVTETGAEFVAQIAFAENVSEKAVRDLLVAVEADIVSGPSALGIYRLGFADADARDRGISVLSKSAEIVDSVIAQ
jgi:hypothetical protein